MRALLVPMSLECVLRHALAAVVALSGDGTLLRMLQQVAVLVTDREMHTAPIVDALHFLFVYLTAQLVVDRTAEVRVRGLRRRGSKAQSPHAERTRIE
jgi:hypothetical protein